MAKKKRFGIDYDNTIDANRELWTAHTWNRDGDEWDGQARLAGVPYEEWKAKHQGAATAEQTAKLAQSHKH